MSNSVGQRAFQNARLQKRQKAEVLPMLGNALQLHKKGLFGQARAAYQLVLELDPDQFIALHMLGSLESDAKNYQQAEIMLSRAVAVDPQSADAHMSRGIALNKLRRHDEARESYRRALALRPNYALALSNLGNASVTLNLQEALACYDKALAIDGNLAEAHNGRGWVLFRLNNYDEAIASLNRALSIKPAYPSALANRAVALRELLRFDEAMADCNQAIAMAPDDMSAWLARAGSVSKPSNWPKHCTIAREPSRSIPILLKLTWCGALVSPNSVGFTRPWPASTEPSRSSLTFRAQSPTRYSRSILWRMPASRNISKHAASGGSRSARKSLQQCRSRTTTSAIRIALWCLATSRRTSAHSAAKVFKPALQFHRPDAVRDGLLLLLANRDAATDEFHQMADRWRDASQWSDDRLADQIRHEASISWSTCPDIPRATASACSRASRPRSRPMAGVTARPGLPTIDYVFADPVTIPPMCATCSGRRSTTCPAC